MKRMLWSLCLIALLAGGVACESEDPEFKTTQNNGLLGKWRLVESLSDPGDGSGTWQKISPEQVQILEFKADSSFLIVSKNGSESGTYRTSVNNRLEMRFAGNSTFAPVWSVMLLTPTNLTVSYGCIEPCGGRYVAVE